VNRKSFLSVLFGSLAALFWGRKAKKPLDPKDLPWRRGRASDPVSYPEVPTNEPIQVQAQSGYRYVYDGTSYVRVGELHPGDVEINPMWHESTFEEWTWTLQKDS